MPVYNASKLFASPKKTPKKRACAPKVPYNECLSRSRAAKCQWVHGKREYCRTRRNTKRSKN